MAQGEAEDMLHGTVTRVLYSVLAHLAPIHDLAWRCLPWGDGYVQEMGQNVWNELL